MVVALIEKNWSYWSSWLVSVARLHSGAVARTGTRRPPHRLELYEFEACPYCRKVREAISILDLEVNVRPCPKRRPQRGATRTGTGGGLYRERVRNFGGKYQFPYLRDPNTATDLYESDAIVSHLFTQYGGGNIPWTLRPGAWTNLWLMLAGMPRRGAGGYFRGGERRPEGLLELYGFEASAETRLVREVLSSLELAYVLRSAAAGSPRRAELLARTGSATLPYLIDPNPSDPDPIDLNPIDPNRPQTAERGFAGAAAIIEHLERSYGRREDQPC